MTKNKINTNTLLLDFTLTLVLLTIGILFYEATSSFGLSPNSDIAAFLFIVYSIIFIFLSEIGDSFKKLINSIWFWILTAISTFVFFLFLLYNPNTINYLSIYAYVFLFISVSWVLLLESFYKKELN